jgi:GTP-binding protein
VAELDEENNLVLADIPGLIEGAHLGSGLGHDFLRHIQRTRVLIHLLDGMAENPLLDYAQTNTELSLFDPALGKKPQVVVLNKMDLPEVQARWPKLQGEFKRRRIELLEISAVTGQNVRQLLYRALQLLKEIPPEPVKEEIPIYRLETDPKAFTITQEEDGWRVSGEAIVRAASMTYWDEFQSIRRFQRLLESLGIDSALRKAGIQEGDTVIIGDYELEWQD